MVRLLPPLRAQNFHDDNAVGLTKVSPCRRTRVKQPVVFIAALRRVVLRLVIILALGILGGPCRVYGITRSVMTRPASRAGSCNEACLHHFLEAELGNCFRRMS